MDQDFHRQLLDQAKGLEGLPAAWVTDAQDGAGAMEAGIHCLTPGVPLWGIALTVQIPTRDNMALYRALKLARPGDVLVVDQGGYLQAAVWGELFTRRAQAVGIRGLVLDGSVRDVADHGPLGFPVFARGVVPNNCPKVGGGEVGVPVRCGGVLVRTGDAVVGDDDGVVVVTRERLADVLNRIPAIRAREQENRRKIEGGQVIPDWLS